MTANDDDYRPTVDDVDPSAMAVNSVDDHVRVHADPDETGIVDSAGETLPVDEDSDGDRIRSTPADDRDDPTAGRKISADNTTDDTESQRAPVAGDESAGARGTGGY